MNWPQALKAYRKLHGLTQKTLAEKLQVSKRAVEQWEDGTNNPPGYLMYALQALASPQPLAAPTKRFKPPGEGNLPD